MFTPFSASIEIKTATHKVHTSNPSIHYGFCLSAVRVRWLNRKCKMSLSPMTLFITSWRILRRSQWVLVPPQGLFLMGRAQISPKGQRTTSAKSFWHTHTRWTRTHLKKASSFGNYLLNICNQISVKYRTFNFLSTSPNSRDRLHFITLRGGNVTGLGKAHTVLEVIWLIKRNEIWVGLSNVTPPTPPAARSCVYRSCQNDNELRRENQYRQLRHTLLKADRDVSPCFKKLKVKWSTWKVFSKPHLLPTRPGL